MFGIGGKDDTLFALLKGVSPRIARVLLFDGGYLDIANGEVRAVFLYVEFNFC